MFEFATAGRVLFGEGVVEQLPDLVRGYGRRVLFVVGATRERASESAIAIERNGGNVAWFQVQREPTVEDVEAGLVALRGHAAEIVVAMGGGSVMDLAKAVAAVATNDGQLTDYLEVIGRGQALERAGLPCIAVPTTAGTGAEVTRNAVIGVPTHATKVSLRGEFLLPRVALVDPRLTLSVPKAVTAATGFDALTQVVEPFVSNRANPMTDALARAGIGLAAKSLRRVYNQGSDISARSDMALVSLWGGMCLANARLGAVHGLAGPMGGMLHLPHGALCAALLGPVMRVNVAALRRQAAGAETLERYVEIARLVTGNGSASAEEGIAWIEQLAAELKVCRLGPLAVSVEQCDELTERALRASSMQGNPVRLSPSDVRTILESVLAAR